MKIVKTKGIVIRSLNYEETSKIVYVFTPLGLLSVMVKGCRRIKSRFLTFSDNFNEVELEITDSSFPVLIDYTLMNGHYKVKEDLKKNLWLSYVLEIANKLPKDIPYEKTYYFLKRIIDLADEQNCMLLALIFQIKVLALYGVKPELNSCVQCGSLDVFNFSISMGGFVCKEHNHESKNYMKEAMDLKRIYNFNISNGNFEELKDIDLVSLFSFVTSYYNYYVEIKLNSLNSLIL